MNRGSLVLNGPNQLLNYVVMKELNLVIRQSISRLFWIDLTHPKYFISINITKSCHMALVKQKWFDFPPASVELMLKKSNRKILWGWFRTDRFQATNLHFISCLHESHPAEFTGIMVAKFGPISKLKNNVSMFINWSTNRLTEILALHSQVGNHCQLVGKPKKQVLAPTVNIFNCLAN